MKRAIKNMNPGEVFRHHKSDRLFMRILDYDESDDNVLALDDMRTLYYCERLIFPLVGRIDERGRFIKYEEGGE